ncbi:MAG TPA: hypothetical protein VFE02_06195 [Candidatus Acidoferrales bacterium]|nr:hypothetical protein [Candidatus Acidoferrales bacterium]
MKISVRFLFFAILTLYLTRSVAAQSPPSPSFSIAISAVQNTAKAGSEIKITALLKNVSEHDLGIARTTGGHRADSFYTLEVRDQSGNLTPKTVLRREIEEHGTANGEIVLLGGSVFTHTLKPNKILEGGIVVTNSHDLSKPGRYTIQCQRFDEETKTIVKSNKLTMTVTP